VTVRLKTGILRLRSPKESFQLDGGLTAASGSVRGRHRRPLRL
jgi:hypothetical protein